MPRLSTDNSTTTGAIEQEQLFLGNHHPMKHCQLRTRYQSCMPDIFETMIELPIEQMDGVKAAGVPGASTH